MYRCDDVPMCRVGQVCKFLLTRSVMFETVGCVAASLTRARRTVWPPWDTSIPQYLGSVPGNENTNCTVQFSL